MLWSCHPSFGGDRSVIRLDGGAQQTGRIMETRSSRPGRDAERLGDLDQGQALVVVQDEDGAMLDAQAPEGAIERVAIVDEIRSSGPAGPSTGRTRTLAVHDRRRLASA